MNLAHLETFVCVLRVGSITGAAGSLHYSQSTVTAHIQALERSVGAKVVHRSASGVFPTPAGERLYCYARTILVLVNEARNAVGRPIWNASVPLDPTESVIGKTDDREGAKLLRADDAWWSVDSP